MINKKPDFVYIEACNFIDYPKGGTLSFALQLLKVFGNRMALVGFTDNKEECGRWTQKKIGDLDYYFFGISVKTKNNKKTLIPARLTSYIALNRNIKKINKISIDRVFTQTPQFALILYKSKVFKDKCFCFAGTTNSVAISRYPLFRIFSKIYEKKLFKALAHFQVILAAADREAIQELKKRSNGQLNDKEIVMFPTRYDDKIFFPQNKNLSRNQLSLKLDKIYFVTTGRLSWVKGWKFLIDAFSIFRKKYSQNVFLIFIGDGEDKKKVEQYINEKSLTHSVLLTGMLDSKSISMYLNACDVYLMGSFYEGWSTAMVEALGCGCPIVTTKVSGAIEMVKNQENGFVVEYRNTEIFADKMYEAIGLKKARKISYNISKRFTLSTLATDLERYCLKNKL